MGYEFSKTFRAELMSLAAKRAMLQECSDIETLVVGSSHGDFAFNPEFVPRSFNLCGRSQDLKYSYHLYKHVAERHAELEHVVLFYSVFSPGFVLEKTRGDSEIAVIANEVFELGLSCEEPDLRRLQEIVSGNLSDITLPGVEKIGGRGHLVGLMRNFLPPDTSAQGRAEGHVKFNKRIESIPYLQAIIDLAKERGHQVLIVLAPARSDYRSFAGSAASLFGHLAPFVTGLNFVQLLNLYGLEEIEDADFGDLDHVHPRGKGASVSSKLIGESILAAKAAALKRAL